MSVFSEELFENFRVKSIKHLRKNFEQQTLEISDDDLRKLINNGVKKAEGHRIFKKPDVLIFIEYMLCYGKDFDMDPENTWAHKALKIRNFNGTKKILRLQENKPLNQES